MPANLCVFITYKKTSCTPTKWPSCNPHVLEPEWMNKTCPSNITRYNHNWHKMVKNLEFISSWGIFVSCQFSVCWEILLLYISVGFFKVGLHIFVFNFRFSKIKKNLYYDGELFLFHLNLDVNLLTKTR